MAEFIGVEHIIINQWQKNELLKNRYKNITFFKQVGDKLIYSLKTPTPLFYGTDNVVISTPDEIVSKIIASPPYQNSKVYVEKEIVLPGETDKELVVTFEKTAWQNNTITVELTTSKEAVLVVNSQFFPGWRAYIDSLETPIFRANYLFQGIVVPAGKHLVTLKYAPRSLSLGLWVSLFGLLLAVCLYFSYKKKEVEMQSV